jgi:hypothetical protein
MKGMSLPALEYRPKVTGLALVCRALACAEEPKWGLAIASKFLPIGYCQILLNTEERPRVK